MKKILVLLVLVAAATTIFFGCSLFGEETYAYDLSRTSGVCVEITTSDFQLKQAALDAGYEIGTCPSTDELGVCAEYAELDGSSFDGIFYSTTGLTDSTAELACEMLNGTWTASR